MNRWDGEAVVDFCEWVEGITEEEADELMSFERGFQKLIAQILDLHSEEIIEYINSCLEEIRVAEEENSQTSAEED